MWWPDHSLRWCYRAFVWREGSAGERASGSGREHTRCEHNSLLKTEEQEQSDMVLERVNSALLCLCTFSKWSSLAVHGEPTKMDEENELKDLGWHWIYAQVSIPCVNVNQEFCWSKHANITGTRIVFLTILEVEGQMEPVAASGCCFRHSCPKYLLLSTASSCIRALVEQGSPFWPFWRLSRQLKFRSSRDVLYNCFGLSKLPECDIIASVFIMLPSIITIYG